MRNQMDRTLTILADGEPVTGYARARLIGTERLGLYPSLFMLHLWNVAEEDYLALSRCKEVTVIYEDAVLVSGTVSDALRSRGKSGTEAHVAIAPGLKLWEAPVSQDIEAGVTVSETVRRLLEASETRIQLLSFPGEDPVTNRGQAFFGRAAECIEEALGKTGASCCLVPSGLCVIPKEGLPVSMVLTEEDLTDVPSFNCGGDMILRMLQEGRLTEADAQSLSTYLAGYVRETAGVREVQDEKWALDGGQFLWSCTVLTEYGKEEVEYVA